MDSQEHSTDKRKILRTKAEVVVFQGIRFYRYPDSPRLEARRYFAPGMGHRRQGIGTLHREIWKSVYGPIPDGCHIHHINGDYSNNSIENLECLTPQEHAREHGNTPRTSKQLAHLEVMRIMALEWHASDEGVAWHKEHIKDMRGKREKQEFDCAFCHKKYMALSNGKNKFCSLACQKKHIALYGTNKNYRLVCPYCHKEFHTSNKKQVCCSKDCVYLRKREQRLKSRTPIE